METIACVLILAHAAMTVSLFVSLKKLIVSNHERVMKQISTNGLQQFKAHVPRGTPPNPAPAPPSADKTAVPEPVVDKAEAERQKEMAEREKQIREMNRTAAEFRRKQSESGRNGLY